MFLCFGLKDDEGAHFTPSPLSSLSPLGLIGVSIHRGDYGKGAKGLNDDPKHNQTFVRFTDE